MIDHPGSALIPLVVGAPLAGDQLVRLTDVGGQVVDEIDRAGQDGFGTVEKAGDGTITTVSKARSDYVQTINKGWRDTRDQTARSFNDTVDGGKAVERFEEHARSAPLANASKQSST